MKPIQQPPLDTVFYGVKRRAERVGTQTHMNSRCTPTSLLLFLMSATAFAEATEWPQFRGPNRDGVSQSTELLKAWPEGGPKLLWTAEGAGRGYSSCAIAAGKLYTLGDAPSTANDDDEYLLCFDVYSGRQLWKKRIGPAWDENDPIDWQSSRSTPTIDGDHAYVLTAYGKLLCCRTTNGAIVWKRDLKADFKGQKGDGWGYSESVLVDGDRVVCTPGGEVNTMVALNKRTGDLIWSTSRPDDRGAGHASIQISEIGAVKVYVNTTASGVLGVRASDGGLMWTYEIDDTTAVIPCPIIHGDLVFFTAGYGCGGALLRQVASGDRVNVQTIYPNNNKLENKHGGVVLVDGYLYGDSGSSGIPFCADLLTGEIVWKKRGSGKGSAAIAAADGHLYILYQNSTLALVKADPGGYVEVSSFRLGDDEADDVRPTWAHPVITDGKLFLRQDDKIFCFDVRSK